MDIFVELTIIILLATIVSIIMKLLKQPFIVGYILTGILVGPYFLNILHSTHDLELFSKIGITILLFIVGLHLNPRIIKEVGKISLITGLGQVIFTSMIGFLVCIALGLSVVASMYVAVALTFSSTIIVLKLLSDKGDIDSLYGKISIGLLLVQDMVATIILIAITTLSNTSAQSNIPLLIGSLALKGIFLAILLVVMSKWLIPKVSVFLSSSQELLFLFSITWGLGIAAVFYKVGFSAEVGALAAGVALSTTSFASEIGSRMKPLRDFFILLFFILLGSQMALQAIPLILAPALILSVFVLIGKPLIVLVLMNLMGYKRRTGFMAGLTVAQISEFSLILAALGVSVGHLSQEALSLVTLVGLITISGSTYFIIYSDYLFKVLDPLLKRLEIRKIKSEKSIESDEQAEIFLFGYDRVGTDFVSAIQQLQSPYRVIDFNPKSIQRLHTQKIPAAFGDAGDIEFLEELQVGRAKLVISTIPDFDTNKLLFRKVIKENPKAITISISHHTADTQELYELGVTYVIMPHFLGAELAAHMIVKHGLDKKSFLEEQKLHRKKLQNKIAQI